MAPVVSPQPSSHQTLTYGRALDLSGGSIPVNVADISGWHRVRIAVPTADINTIFRWTREKGSYEATTDAVDYWRLVALLVRCFYNFVDYDTPTTPTTDPSGNLLDPSGDGIIDRRFVDGLSFTTPPTVAPDQLENPKPLLNSTQILPNNFNTLLLRWALWKLYGTSRPVPGTVLGLHKGFNMVTNFAAARAIAQDFYQNTEQVDLMLSAMKANDLGRYFALNGSGGIVTGYEGLVDTEKAEVDTSGDWGWFAGDILDIPMRIQLPTFNSNGEGHDFIVEFRLQLEVNDDVPSWKTPYGTVTDISTNTVTSEYAAIDAAVLAVRSVFADKEVDGYDLTTYAGTRDLINDLSDNLYVYGEARGLRDFFAWLGTGDPAPATATDINYIDASGDAHTAHYTLWHDTIGVSNQKYLPYEIEAATDLLTDISDASANVFSLKAARDRYLELITYVGSGPGIGEPADVSNAIIALDTSANTLLASATGYKRLYDQVFDDAVLTVEHNALNWWALSSYLRYTTWNDPPYDTGGWTDISENGESLGPGTGIYAPYPLYTLDASNNVLPRIDVSPFLKDKRLEEYNKYVADLAAARALLSLANLGPKTGSNKTYIDSLVTDISGLLLKVSDASGDYWTAKGNYEELADTSLVELVLDGSGQSLYYDPVTKDISSNDAVGYVELAEPIRDLSGFVLDSEISLSVDVSGYYTLDASGATIGLLYPTSDYVTNGAGFTNQIHAQLLFYTTYPATVLHSPSNIPRLSIEEEYRRYYAPALVARDNAITDASGLRELILPLFEAWPILDASGNTIALPDKQYNDANADLSGYLDVYTAIIGDASGDFEDFLDKRAEVDVKYTTYETYVADVSGWMNTHGGTYVDLSDAPITTYFTDMSGGDPLIQLTDGGVITPWSADPYVQADVDAAFNTPYHQGFTTFDAALTTFVAQAPKNTPPAPGISDLAHTPILNTYKPSPAPLEPAV